MRYILSTLFLILILIFSLPYVASTRVGTSLVSKLLSSKSSQVKIKDLSLGWFDMQKVEGITALSKAYDVSIDLVTCHHSLFEILFKGGDLGKTKVVRPKIVLKDRDAKGGSLFFPMAADVYIEDASISSGNLSLQKINAQIGIPPNHSIVVVKAKGETSNKGINGYFDIDSTIYRTMNETSDIAIKLRSLPTFAIDQVLKLIDKDHTPLFTKSFGPTLNADLNAKFGLTEFNAKLQIQSERMNGSLKAYYDKGGISVEKGGTLTWLMDPSFLKLVKIPYEVDLPSKLTVNQLHFPYEKGNIAFNHSILNLTLSTDRFTLDVNTTNLEKSVSVLIRSNELQGEFKVLTPLKHPHVKRAVAKATNFPLYLLNDYGDVTGVFGDKLSGNLDYTQGLYTLDLTTPLLKLDQAKITYVDEKISLKKPAHFSYRDFSGEITAFEGELQAFKATLNPLKYGEAELKNVSLFYKSPELNLIADGHTGKVSFDINLMTQVWDLKLKDFSTYTLGTFFGGGTNFPSMIGPQIDLRMTQENGAFDLNATADNLYLDGTVKELKPGIYEGGPLELEWKLSDTSYHALARWLKKPSHDKIKIKESAKLKVDVHQLEIPLPCENLNDIKLTADLNLDDLLLDPDYRLSHLKATVVRNKTTQFTFKGDAKSKWHTGSFNFTGTEAKSLRLKGSVENVPAIFLDLLPIPYHASAILGDRITASLDAYLKNNRGYANVDINSPQCQAVLRAKLDNGRAYLQKPFQAAIAITPAFSDLFFKNMGIAVASATKPLTVYIDPKGFEFPYRNYKVRALKMPFARVDIGQLIVRNRGNPEDVSELFKMKFNERQLIDLWFAPMDLRVNNGLMKVDRTEVLYNKAQEVCYFGQIDLYREYVDMILGLTAQSLDSALGLALPDGYVLQIPLRGPYGNVELNKEAAMSQIAMLIAGRVGSAIGGPWGDFLGAFGEAASNQRNVPPPKHPFPWEHQASAVTR